MNYIFFGSYEFAKIVLERFIEYGKLPLAVVCNPDKPVGRKKVITPPPVKKLAEHYKIPVFQPENAIEIKKELGALSPEIMIVAAYAKIIPQDILDIPKFGTFGIHPSLLPLYRGASPIQTAILDGREKTGTTIFKVDRLIDHGPILSQKELPVEPTDTYLSLEKKLAHLGVDLFIEKLSETEIKETYLTEQDEKRATLTKKFKTEDGFVDYKDIESAQKDNKALSIEIEKRVRSLGHEPGVWTIRDGKRMKLLQVSLIPDGLLHIKKIHIEGKKPQNV